MSETGANAESLLNWPGEAVNVAVFGLSGLATAFHG
jgi:hypothetical protein